MRNKILVILLVVSLQGITLATGGSTYTRLGLGEFNYSFSARRFGLGELGYALSDRDFLSYTNPASWNQIGLTRFETGIMINASDQSSSSKSVFNSNSNYTGLMVGFPISRENGISFAAGIVPYTNVGYEVISTEKDNLVDDYTTTYTGSGGIFKFFVGTSYRLPFGFSLGASFDYYNGKINNETSVAFNDSSAFRDATFLREFSYHGIGATFGLISSDLSKLFGESDFKDFRIGLSFSPQISMSSDSTNTFTSLIGDYEFNSGVLKSKLPYRLGIGASFKLSDNYLFVLDYMTQPMSKFSWGTQTTSPMQDINKYSFGVEYRPSYDAIGFWKQISLRGGVGYEQTPYIFNGTSINQLSLYAGFSLPIGYENTLDLGFQYGRRGTTDNNLIQENIYKVFITISLGELWFIQTER